MKGMRLSNNAGKAILGTLGAIILGVGTLITTIPNKADKSVPIEYRDASNVCYVFVHGHAPVYNGIYGTQGKQSPEWADSLKIYEGESCRELVVMLSLEMIRAGIDFIWLNPFETDMTLQERVSKTNELYKKDKRVVFISLHHNAQPVDNGDYTDKHGQKGFTSASTGGATGTESYTSVGWTTSDSINNYYIIPELKQAFPEMKWRKGTTHDGKEANFYVLKYTNCPAVLIEWGFMTTYTDCQFIDDDYNREVYVKTIAQGLINYNKSKKI